MDAQQFYLFGVSRFAVGRLKSKLSDMDVGDIGKYDGVDLNQYFIFAVTECIDLGFMTDQERIKANAAKGYIHVFAGDGYEIYKKPNEVGAYTYYSDKNSNEGHLAIFDSAIMDKEELIAIAKDAYGLQLIS